MLSLGKILQSKQTHSPLVRGIKAAMVVEFSNSIITEFWGEAGTRYARALYVKNKILTIACLSSAMTQEIKLREKEIVEKINSKNGGRVIEKIRCLA